MEPDAEDREKVECDYSSDEDLDDDQVEQASSNTVQKKGNSLQKKLPTKYSNWLMARKVTSWIATKTTATTFICARTKITVINVA